MLLSSSSLTFVLLAIAQLVAGHGAIIKAVGDAGGNGTALGSQHLLSSNLTDTSANDRSRWLYPERWYKT
jgi:hypothetical protein